MRRIWISKVLDVRVDYDDFRRAHEAALERGEPCDIIAVEAEVDIDEALEHATLEQLIAALAREQEGYTLGQIDAIHDCFAAAVNGDRCTARALLARIFDHQAQIIAAESGMTVSPSQAPSRHE